MTIKFNFYDIYGCAIPGFVLFALLWLPFGLVSGKWPDTQLSSALVWVILAYVGGHVMQQVASKMIPSKVVEGRYPSVAILDEKNDTFSREFKERLAQQIITAFGLDASFASSDITRRDAFFLCRSALIRNKTVTYAEQFEGLYAMMRGLSVAFGICVVYYLGWAYSGLLQFAKTFRFVPASWWSQRASGLVVLAGIIIALAALANANRLKYAKPLMIASFLAVGFASGYYLGVSRVEISNHRYELIVAAVFSFFAAERCYTGYKAFAQEFAKTVYRDFSNYEKPPDEGEANANDNDSAVTPA